MPTLGLSTVSMLTLPSWIASLSVGRSDAKSTRTRLVKPLDSKRKCLGLDSELRQVVLLR